MRKLASIQKIIALEPIEGADAIEVATVLGWKCVVKKGDFRVEDLCVYIEVDSVLPDRPEFEFMKPRGMRVRTIRLRGQVSYGLAMPIYPLMSGFDGLLPEGTDVSDMIGITKYDPPIPAQLAGDVRGLFPSFLEKTNEDRIQSFPDILQKFPQAVCRVCEKLDGSSATFYYVNGEFGVCSRNLDLKESESNSFWRVARQLDIEAKLRDFGENIALHGELIGEGIQKNKYGLKGQKVMFFDVFGIDAHKPIPIKYADMILEIMGLEPVPNLCDLLLGNHAVETLVDLATRTSALADTMAEGIVVRSYEDMTETFITNKTVNRGRISFKVISPEFLLKHGE